MITVTNLQRVWENSNVTNLDWLTDRSYEFLVLQEDKDLVHEFVQNDGLACLIKVGSEADQNYQNYILRGEYSYLRDLLTSGITRRSQMLSHRSSGSSLVRLFAFISVFSWPSSARSLQHYRTLTNVCILNMIACRYANNRHCSIK